MAGQVACFDEMGVFFTIPTRDLEPFRISSSPHRSVVYMTVYYRVESDAVVSSRCKIWEDFFCII